MARPWSTSLKTAVSIVLLTVALVVSAELLVRAYEWATQTEVGTRGPLIEDPVIGFSLSPRWEGYRWDTYVRLDDWGLRNEHTPSSDPSRQRILNFGDSTTFGVSVPAERVYSSILQDLLDRQYPGRFEVINAGVPGYSSREIRRQIEDAGLLERIRPDIITVYVGWNDHWLKRPPTDGARPAAVSWLAGLKARAATRLHLIRAAEALRETVARAVRGWMLKERRLAEVADLLRRSPDEERRAILPQRMNVAPDEFEHNLNAIVNDARLRGCSVIFLIPPSALADRLPEYVDRYPIVSPVPFFFHDAYRDLERNVGTAQGAVVIDLQPRFDAQKPSTLFVDPIHPNADGHRIIAEALVPWIASLAGDAPPKADDATVTAH
jgi:lysophospholipase L1-like esterase